MILVFATSKGVVTTAANPPVHIKPEHRLFTTWYYVTFILQFPITLPKSLLYHYVHLIGSRTGCTHENMYPHATASVVNPHCMAR